MNTSPSTSTSPSEGVVRRASDGLTPARLYIGLALLGVSFMVNAMDRQVFYPFLPEISKDYGFSLAQGGLLATGFTLGMAIAGVPAGYLVDRYSRKTVLLVSIAIYSIGTIATPFATGFADMAAYRLISGAGEGMQAAALYAALGAFFFLHRSFAFGALGVAFGVGVFIGPLIGNELATAFGTWRSPFIFFGCAGLTVALLIGLLVKRQLTERVVGTGSISSAHYDHLPESPYNRNSICLAISASVGGLAFYGFLGLYPTYLKTQLGFSTGQAALATSMIGLGAAMSLVAGWFGDRFDPKTVLIITYAGIAVSALFVFNGPDDPAWHYTFAFIFATFAAGSLFNNVNSALQRSVRPAKVGRAGGLFISSYYAAAAISGFVMATLVENFGWTNAALTQFTLVPIVGIAVLWFVDSSKIIKKQRPSTSSAS
jgi:MFS family permease